MSHKTRQELYEEACARPQIEGFILVRDRPDKFGERCLLLTTRPGEIPTEVQKRLDTASVMVPYSYSTSRYSEHVMKMWFIEEIRSSWTKFQNTRVGKRTLGNAFLCALEFFRGMHSDGREACVQFQSIAREAVDPNKKNFDVYKSFVEHAFASFVSGQLVTPEVRVLGYIIPWIPDFEIPKPPKQTIADPNFDV